MVNRGTPGDGDSYRDRSFVRDERGQLLLVGAIAIALVLMGLVVVFNTVLYTETTAPTETLESADEAEALNQQVRNDTREILFRIANNSTNAPNNTMGYDADVISAMGNYSEVVGISYANTGPVYVNITVHGVDGNATETSACPASVTTADPLCANYTVVFSTQKFTYEKTNKVAVDPP